MKTFAEFQALTTNLPASLRNNRERIQLPILGLQEEAGKIGALLAGPSSASTFNLTPEQRDKLRQKLGEILWFVAVLCHETGLTLQDVAEQSLAQLKAWAESRDPDRR